MAMPDAVEPFDVEPAVLRAVADVIDALAEHGVSVWGVDYESHPNDALREPVWMDVATHADIPDDLGPTSAETHFPAPLVIQSEHGDIDIRVDGPPSVQYDAHSPRSAIWTLLVTVSTTDDDAVP